MQDCVQMFITSLQKKCYEDNGFAVVDFFHMFANLSFVSIALLTLVLLQLIKLRMS